MAAVAACLCFVAPRGCVSIVLTVFAQFGFVKEWVNFGIGSFAINVDAIWNGFLVRCDQKADVCSDFGFMNAAFSTDFIL